MIRTELIIWLKFSHNFLMALKFAVYRLAECISLIQTMFMQTFENNNTKALDPDLEHELEPKVTSDWISLFVAI